MKKPDIKYPCEWSYTVIGTDEDIIREAVCECLGDRGYSIFFSKKSEHGKYISLNIKTNVLNEDDRNKIYSVLCKCSSVKTIL